MVMSDTVKPPIARILPKMQTIHGETRTDNYFWLREKNNPDVIAYLEAENAYTEAMMQDTKELQEKLYQEMKSRIKETDLSVPYKQGEYMYYSRTVEGKQYAIYCRKKGSMEAPEQITLDLNVLAEGKQFLRLGVYSVSPNGKLLAYGLDVTGARRFTLFVKNLETGELLSDQIPETGASFAWANDNVTFFYNVYDSSLRSYKILRHRLGTDPANDVEVFHERDEKFDCYVSKTRSERYIIISTNSKMTGECWYLDANTPQQAFRCIEPRTNGHEYSVTHHDKHFVILTNDQAKNFRVMVAPLDKPSKKYWKEVIPHRPHVKIEDIDTFAKFWALSIRENGLTAIELYDVVSRKSHRIGFPEQAYLAYVSTNPEYNTMTLRYGYTSLITPNSVYNYDVVNRTSVLLKQQEVPGGYNPEDYVVERLAAKSHDGVMIPLSLVYRKGLQKNGLNPTLLYAYGSYGISTEPTFNSNRISLLDRGFIYAIAHIRGGGEMGKQWYEDGKLLKKKNTFLDYIAAAEHLITQGYTNPQKLVANGGSAGGLLMGAVMNMRPDLFKAVHAAVPFVDVINTMLDASLPLTTAEYEEWGNPNEKHYYDYMKSYSPYDNITAQAYPALLLTTGLNDTQVPYWEPAKFCAKLRATKTDTNMLLFKITMGVGHGGSSGRYDALRERAFEYAFFLKALGIRE
ncbi:MAG: S9 family peptidase [Candidatus Kapabacteria bacterium]|nr:S9 family peptidase [Candidatus Kapabacteria bacterium]